MKNFQPLSLKFTGLADTYARFIEREQLSDRPLWKKFVQVFRDHSDLADEGWRCEYWGKMMRGACMTYRYTQSEQLYEILTETVKDLLSAQDPSGRFSGYPAECEFRGWDIWGRKYVLVGLEYYYEICRDKALKAEILNAMCRHADYMAENLGEGKTSILETSEWWGGVNSCTVLEPMVQLYKLTGKIKYLEFAEYVISTGGCRDGNLIESVRAGKMPHEFPEVKAYETMSFFEGLLAYYEASGKAEYLQTVIGFAESVFQSDITIIGCAGCTHEVFDHSAEKQTEFSETIMQETCVTVTWMRLCARLWENTFDAKYVDRIEQSARNAFYGSINTQKLQGYSFEKQALTPPLPFDSYSPLYNNVRGRGVGGFKEFPEGGNYGCCACIGAAGTALYPLYSVVSANGTFYWNFYLNGEVSGKTPRGQSVLFVCHTQYPAEGTVRLRLSLVQNECFKIALRVPDWCEGAEIEFGGMRMSAERGYFVTEREWQDGDEIVLHFPLSLRAETRNGRTAFSYGALVLARDEEKERGDITEHFSLKEGVADVYRLLKEENGEQIRIEAETSNGEKVLFTDYASCGKNWTGARNRVTVWMNVERSR